MKLKDITGQRFGELVAIRQIESNEWGKTRWLCQCDCGTKRAFIVSHLKSGMTKSCGCLRHREAHNAIDITGKKYGMLTVLEKAKGNNNKRKLWLCRCDCGNEKVIPGTPMRIGSIKSCGCLLHVSRRGKESPNYKKGYSIRPEGYIVIKGKDRNGKWKDRPEHVLIMEKYLGRNLTPEETVHHKNGIKADNRINNLELWSKKHSPGQRVEDMISFCINYLSEYAPEYLAFLKEKKCA